MNYYERHIGDYLKDTAHLSLLEHGVYCRLLDVYYTREAPLSEADAMRLIGARSKDERAAVASVLREFFQLSGDLWSHKRCDAEIERYQKRVEHNRRVGQLGGRPRTRSEPARNPVGFQTEPESNPPRHQTPVTSKEEPTVLVDKPSASRPPPCPTEALIGLYHEHLPMLPRVEVLNDTRRRAISARWREVVTDPDIARAPDVRTAALDWWAWFFGHCAKSRFLTGRAKDWRADLDFLLTPSKFARVVEGTYHKEAA